MDRQKQRARTPALEWLSAATGLVLTLALLALLGKEALLGQRDDVPAVDVRVERVVEKDGVFVVEVEAVNHSGATASAVMIEGRLGEATSNATIDYVPGHSRRRAGLYFREDPRGGPLEVRALGYQEP